MNLLSGADISIRLDQEKGLYVATVMVGFTSKVATADNPVEALGKVIMLQAGYTEGTLHNELAYLNGPDKQGRVSW